MRRLPAFLLIFASIALVGAARPTPAPKPAPTATPAAIATPAARQALPIVVVFPFDISSDLRAGTGQTAAQVFVEQMNADGGVDAIEAPPTVKRDDYVKYAQSVNASYYVAGYMTPLGSGVSLVEQVVSTRTGTIVFGQTAQIESIQDATAQATYIHDGIVQREQQLADAYSEAQAQGTPPPASGNQAKTDISAGLSSIAGLFHHNRAGGTPPPVVKKPAKGILVAHVFGPLPASDLTKATSALYSALNQRFNVRMTNAAGDTLTKTADALCGTDRDNTLATGSASAKSERRTFGVRTQYSFALQIYTCFGARLAEATGTGDSLTAAVQNAVSSYASAHPDNS